ncbi:hypothetical protein PC9H_008293 [Pleurotus ostreatus]|uniref:DUF6593 domain-containing protein n=1 Tax=Pleurotus ostreatus TaxID=5322 RepID=A0A8H6ZSE1_PLEOS|nr:uncharacterized protein PC9H_008293 [Pleurotus ostreatus]KAF7425931.1 hypothetical protein PC9H_008293 [Pleurotus ostreatus]KAJ8693327.1 hypothetical protein PTI98_008332 [Pleurotus ostreatus]
MASTNRSAFTTAAQRGVQLFEFSSSHVLDSVVFSGRTRRFEVSSSHRQHTTTIRCFSPERTVCTIDWGTRIVEIPDGSAPKQRISEYLALDRRRKTRKLTFGDVEYTWIPKKDGFSLYNKKTNQDMANIWTLPGHPPRVEIYCHSVHAGLLDSCVIAAVLFLSKRNLDIDNDRPNV